MTEPSQGRRRDLTKRYHSVLERVCATLYRVDPMGIANGNPHLDEYSAEAERILARADEAGDVRGLAGIVREVFAAQFGSEDVDTGMFEDIAKELWPVVRQLRGKS
jgi:hypothetical protein